MKIDGPSDHQFIFLSLFFGNNMRITRILFFFALAAGLIVGSVQAQGLDSTLQKLSRDVAKSYIAPIVSGFGADLNSGWMYRAPAAKKFGIDIDFGIVVMGSFMPDDSKKFSTSGSFQFDRSVIDAMTPNQDIRNALYTSQISVSISGATIVGSKKDSIRVSYTGTPVTVRVGGRDTTLSLINQTQILPVGGLLEDIPVLLFLAPQLSLGTVFGTKVIIRYLPDIEISKDLGKFSYFGFGLQHNPFMWIPVPEPPVDVSIGFFTQTMKVGTILETSATMFGAQASKTFGPGALSITPYAGFSFESSTMRVKYSFLAPNPAGGAPIPTPITPLELEGENSARFTIGASLKLAFIKLNADYNIAKFNTFSAGLGIII